MTCGWTLARAEIDAIRDELDRLELEQSNLMMRVATLDRHAPDFAQQVDAIATHALDMHDRQAELAGRIEANHDRIKRL